MAQKLILIRGLPGSGKSTLAQTLDAEHIETDMYFVNRDGEYCFDANKLTVAHQWCEQQVEQLLMEGFSVVVSNTFVRYWEMQPYVEMAQRLNIDLQVIRCLAEFGSIHGVDAETVKKMRTNWQACEWLVQKDYQPE